MTEAEARKIVTESRRRLARLTEPYNPLTGEGSPIPRVPLRFDAARPVLIPDYMARTPTVRAILAAGSVERYAAQNGVGP